MAPASTVTGHRLTVPTHAGAEPRRSELGVLSLGKVTRGQIGYYTQQVAHGDGVRAAGYYARTDEPPGQWAGQGAAALGLAGPVRTGQLETLLDGAHPLTGEQLGRAPLRTLAVDATFSACKAVSLVGYLLDDATHRHVLAAHTTAVTAALGWLEAEAAVVRRGHGGAVELPASGLIAARFDHATSRALDPQLHSHLLISSLAAGPDGRVTQLHTAKLYAAAKTAGCLYQATLRGELTARLGVDWTPVVNGQAEIAGMPRELLGEFSRRRLAIDAEVQRLLAEARAANEARRAAGRPELPLPSGRALWEQATLASRTAKDHTADLAALVPAWQQRARQLGMAVDNPDVYLAALRRAAPARQPLNWPQLAARLAGPDGLTRDRAWVDRRDVIQAIAAAVHELPPSELEPAETAAQAAVRLADRWCAEHAVPLHTPEQAAAPTGRFALRYTTAAQLQLERQALAAIVARQGETTTGLGSPATAERLIAALTLGEEQAAAVRILTSRGAGADVVTAPAGAGKTTLLAAAVASWQDAGHHVIGCSTAAKAVRELAAGAGIDDARTVASLVRQLAAAERVEHQLGEDGHPRPVRVPFTLHARHVLVVDEAAMASTRDLHALLTAAQAASAKTVLCGDPAQLPSIQAGGLLQTAMNTLDAPGGPGSRTVRLTETRRATEAWERDAQLAWHRGDPATALAVLEQHDRVAYCPDRDAAHAAMLTAWQARRGELAAAHAQACQDGRPPEPVMVAFRRADVHALNQAARAARLRDGEIADDRSVSAAADLGGPVGYTPVRVAVGEPLITTLADPALGVINGTRGTVAAVRADGALTMRTAAGDIDLPASYLTGGGVLHAYALSGHRSQGTTAEAAIVLADTSTLTAEWGYSAATRGRRNELVVVTSDNQRDQHTHPRTGPEAEATRGEQRAALLAAMARHSDQITALEAGAEALGAAYWVPEPDQLVEQTPTADNYLAAARTAQTPHVQRQGPTQTEIDAAAHRLAANQTKSERQAGVGLAPSREDEAFELQLAIQRL